MLFSWLLDIILVPLIRSPPPLQSKLSSQKLFHESFTMVTRSHILMKVVCSTALKINPDSEGL